MPSDEMEFIWNDHLLNFSELFNTLYKDNSLVDVTIACQGGFLRAHKLVLSACSSYFKEIFQENPCKHPTIILRSVSFDDMNKIIEYMYRGSVNIASERLDTILQIASDLNIKGFENKKMTRDHSDLKSGQREDNNEQIKATNTFKGTTEIGNKSNHLTNFGGVMSTRSSAVCGGNINGKKESLLGSSRENDDDDAPLSCSSENEDDEDAEANNKMITKTDPINCVHLFDCEICNRRFKSRKDLQKHKKIHQDKSFSCEFCTKLFSRASHLIRHRRVHTGERPFVCEACGKDFARQDKLKLHIRTSHGNVIIEASVKATVAETNGIDEVHSSKFDDVESESEFSEHITLENLMTNSNISSDEYRNKCCGEKRGRGRPRKYPVVEIRPKRSRGRPRKDESNNSDQAIRDNYDITSLPYGDINYLTMPLEQAMTIEPLVEIDTEITNVKMTTEQDGFKKNIENEADYGSEELKTIGKIGECTISFN